MSPTYFFVLAILVFLSCKDNPTNNITSPISDTNILLKDHTNRSKDTTLRILSAGMPIIWAHSYNIIAKKWGFQYYHIGGCEVTQELLDSIDANNIYVDSILRKRYGDSWKTKFNKEESIEDSINQIIINLLDHVPLVIEKRKAHSENIRYTLEPISNSSKYKVEGNYVMSNPIRGFRAFSILVDYRTKAIQIINDKDEMVYQQP